MPATAVKYLSAALLMLLVLPIALKSQEIWTLEKCIEYAWANNLNVKQQNIEVSRAENQLTQDKLDFIPSLNASLGHNLN